MRNIDIYQEPVNPIINDVVELTTDELIEMLTHSFQLFIESNQVFEHPSVFLHGQPGLGKSQAVYQIARNLEKLTKKRVNVTDIRLLLFTPVDLRGIPIANKKKQTSIWLKPEVFNLRGDKDTLNILFLDELTSAPSSIQAAAYQIALEKRMGEHKLPPNTFIIAAGNRIDDHAISYEMPTALRNRFMHIELRPDLETWKTWAKEHHIHPKIMSFLTMYPDKFYTKDLSTKSPIIITPRTWEMLSKLMHRIDGQFAKYQHLIGSLVGTYLTSLLIEDNKGFSAEPIISGELIKAPESLEETQGIIHAIEERLAEVIESKHAIINIYEYMKLLPVDYSLRLFKKILTFHPQSYEMTSLKEYQEMIDILEEKIHEQV